MSTVVAVNAKGEKAGIIVTDDGQNIWTPEKAKADELVGKPIPSDWTIKQGDYGPQAFPPREKKGFGGGAPAAFRNTKDGFYAEQQSIHRSVALDKALAFHALHVEPPTLEKLLGTADKVYAWLSNPSQGSQASGGAAAPTQPLSGGQPPTTSPVREGQGRAQNRTQTEGGTASPATGQESFGEGSSVPSGVCAHLDNSPLKPDGSALPRGFVRCLGCGVVHKEG